MDREVGVVSTIENLYYLLITKGVSFGGRESGDTESHPDEVTGPFESCGGEVDRLRMYKL